MTQSSPPNLISTESIDWISQQHRDHTYRYKELSGKSLGARLEELPPGQSSSYHHYHTSEEEHVFMLSGEATLVFGEQEKSVATGDHLWFAAGEEIAHHLENRSADVCTYLVYGERKSDDVVVYPEAQIMMVKALGKKQFTFRPVDNS